MPPVIISVVAGLGMIFGLLGGVFLTLSKVKLPAPPRPHHVSFSDSAPAAPKTFEDVSKVASELDSWRRDLNEKNEKALALDAELARREEILRAEREALDKEKDRLAQVQKDMESRLIKIRTDEAPRLEELAGLYKTMKPDSAVDLMRALPSEQVTKILTVMDRKVQAKLLSLWVQKYPGDKAVVAQITNDLVRTTADSTSDGSGSNTP
jgi:Mg/Co/Ni transporter MgtE